METSAQDRLDAMCRALPEVFFGTSWGDAPTYLVRQRAGDVKGRGFVLFRTPRADAIDPQTAAPYPDLVVFRTPSSVEKQALVAAPGPFFTIDHFANYNAVLVQLSRLAEIDDDELHEITADAWRTVAPKRLVTRWEKAGQ